MHTSNYKRVIVALRLNGATGRNELSGIFKFLERNAAWDLHVAQEADDLNDALTSASPPDGVIVGLLHTDKTLDLLARSAIPTVAIDIGADRFAGRTRSIAYVRTDDDGIGRLAGNYLLSLGNLRSIGFIPARVRRPWSQLRQRAFTARLVQQGRNVSVYSADSADMPSLSAWLAALPKPAGVLMAWDGLAPAVFAAARAASIRIPGQLAILGVDNDTFICDAMRPTLSSIRPDYEQCGLQAAKCLERLMRGIRRMRPIVRCPVRDIVERESTAPVAPATSLILRAIDFIVHNAASRITPTDVARQLGVSRRLLDLRFREFHSSSVADTIAAVRLEVLKTHLRETHLPIGRITANLGYRNSRSIKNFFKARVGMSMRAWRLVHAPNQPLQV